MIDSDWEGIYSTDELVVNKARVTCSFALKSVGTGSVIESSGNLAPYHSRFEL